MSPEIYGNIFSNLKENALFETRPVLIHMASQMMRKNFPRLSSQ